MLSYAILFVVLSVLVWIVRGDPDCRLGPFRFILLWTLFTGVPLGFGEYRGMLREGRTNPWVVVPIYLAAGFISGCFMWFILGRKPWKPLADTAAFHEGSDAKPPG